MSSTQASPPSIDQADIPQWKMDLIQQRKKRLFGQVNSSIVSGCNDVNTGKFEHGKGVLSWMFTEYVW